MRGNPLKGMDTYRWPPFIKQLRTHTIHTRRIRLMLRIIRQFFKYKTNNDIFEVKRPQWLSLY